MGDGVLSVEGSLCHTITAVRYTAGGKRSARTIERICIMAKTNNDNIEVDLQILGKSF